MDQALFVLSLFGSWYILGASVISLRPRQWLYDTKFRPFRFLVEMLGCPACYGFWAGFFFAILAPQHADVLTHGNVVAQHPLVLGCIACALNILVARLTGHMQSPSASTHEVRLFTVMPQQPQQQQKEST